VPGAERPWAFFCAMKVNYEDRNLFKGRLILIDNHRIKGSVVHPMKYRYRRCIEHDGQAGIIDGNGIVIKWIRKPVLLEYRGEMYCRIMD